MVKGKIIHGEVRTILLKVVKYFEKEKILGQPVFPFEKALERAQAATGYQVKTLSRIRVEGRKIENQLIAVAASNTPASNAPETSTTPVKPDKLTAFYLDIELPTPGLGPKKPRSDIIGLNETELDRLHQIVARNTKNGIPKFKKITEIAQKELNFRGKRATLRRIIMNKLGYQPKTMGERDKKVTKAKVKKTDQKTTKKQPSAVDTNTSTTPNTSELKSLLLQPVKVDKMLQKTKEEPPAVNNTIHNSTVPNTSQIKSPLQQPKKQPSVVHSNTTTLPDTSQSKSPPLQPKREPPAVFNNISTIPNTSQSENPSAQPKKQPPVVIIKRVRKVKSVQPVLQPQVRPAMEPNRLYTGYHFMSSLHPDHEQPTTSTAEDHDHTNPYLPDRLYANSDDGNFILP